MRALAACLAPNIATPTTNWPIIRCAPCARCARTTKRTSSPSRAAETNDLRTRDAARGRRILAPRIGPSPTPSPTYDVGEGSERSFEPFCGLGGEVAEDHIGPGPLGRSQTF